eukprot:scaffold370_cov289-Prasinococcus_capsulatus_cf.AAC.21
MSRPAPTTRHATAARGGFSRRASRSLAAAARTPSLERSVAPLAGRSGGGGTPRSRRPPCLQEGRARGRAPARARAAPASGWQVRGSPRASARSDTSGRRRATAAAAAVAMTTTHAPSAEAS